MSWSVGTCLGCRLLVVVGVVATFVVERMGFVVVDRIRLVSQMRDVPSEDVQIVGVQIAGERIVDELIVVAVRSVFDTLL